MTVHGELEQAEQRRLSSCGSALCVRLTGRGVTEIVYETCGPDVRRELERFHVAVAA